MERNCPDCPHPMSLHDAVGCMVGAGKIRQCRCRRKRQTNAPAHKIDTETLQCSCHAPMCFSCGWCSAMCVCLDKGQH